MPVCKRKFKTRRQSTAVILKPAHTTGKVIQRRSEDIETFDWHICPAFNRFTGTVYTDGSSLGWGQPYKARTGWAFVVLDDAGRVVAAASGRPPPWIRSSSSIEAWAFYMAILHAAPGCSYRIDSKICVRTFHNGENNVTSHDKPNAMLWKWIFNAINEERKTMGVVWMPAHTGKTQIGKAKLGNGELLKPIDQRGNAMADAMAKLAAKEHRAPEHICTQEEEVEHVFRTIESPAVLLRSAAQIEAIRHIGRRPKILLRPCADARDREYLRNTRLV